MALAAGVDLIDVKEPNLGALGAPTFETVEAILQAVGNEVPVSMALGELVDLSLLDANSQERQLPSGLSFVKVGLAGCASLTGWQEQWKQALQNLPQGTERVAVIYADHEAAESPDELAILELAVQAGCRTILVDTMTKNGGCLFDFWSEEKTADLVNRVQQTGCQVVLAGSLAGPALARAANLRPDFVAVRGAVCASGRASGLDAKLLQQVSQIVLESCLV